MSDREHDGADTDQIGTMVRACGMNPTEDQVKEYASKIDPDQDGQFQFDEFVVFLSKIWIDRDWELDIREAFQIFDDDDSGFVSSAELSHVLANLGERLTEKEIENIFAEGDKNADGQLDMEEFVQLLAKDQAVVDQKN